jgi:site-specific DNA-methyltransferase (adenine-specific)
MDLKTIPISDIEVGERFREDLGDIDGLAASLKKDGQIQPLAVKQMGDKYILLAGGRRLTACKLAGIDEVGVRIYPETLSEIEMRSIELMENVCRKDLSWSEVSELRKKIYLLQVEIHGRKIGTGPDASGVSMRDVAALIGISHSAMHEDVILANAKEIFPQLKEARNRAEAQKMLKKLQEEVVMAEISQRIRNKSAGTPIERIKADLIGCYIVQDFFEGIRKVPNNSIDLVEIDPPYGIDLGYLKTQQADKKDSVDTTATRYNEVPSDQYIPFINNLYKECFRVMSENSWLICWFGFEPWFEIVYQALMRAGFKGNRMPGIWYKEGMTGSTISPAYHLGNVVEPFFYVRKGNPSISKQGRSNTYAYKVVSSGKKVHPTERPVEMIQDVLQTFGWEGCRVLVPFLGSGNTLLAASNLGMTGFGFDLSEEYRNAYILRVNESAPQQYKSYAKEVDDVPF